MQHLIPEDDCAYELLGMHTQGEGLTPEGLTPENFGDDGDGAGDAEMTLEEEAAP